MTGRRSGKNNEMLNVIVNEITRGREVLVMPGDFLFDAINRLLDVGLTIQLRKPKGDDGKLGKGIAIKLRVSE